VLIFKKISFLFKISHYYKKGKLVNGDYWLRKGCFVLKGELPLSGVIALEFEGFVLGCSQGWCS
jgi:hypothetical protein